MGDEKLHGEIAGGLTAGCTMRIFLKHLRRGLLLLTLLLGAPSPAEADWLPASSIALSPSDRILVLTPHPDDEVLG